jgi:hypothetical protein
MANNIGNCHEFTILYSLRYTLHIKMYKLTIVIKTIRILNIVLAVAYIYTI